MIIIELEISNQLNYSRKTDIQTENLIQELQNSIDYIRSDSLSKDEIILNYYNQKSAVSQLFTDAMIKVEKQLFKIWNLDGAINVDYIDNEHKSVTSVIEKNLTRKFETANSMSEVNKKSVLNNCKKEIIKYFYTELDEYAKNYDLSDELLENIRNDVPNLVDKNFNSVVNKIFNDNVRDELNDLCDELEDLYDKEEFSKMNKVANKISKYISEKTTIYKDSNLYERLRISMSKVQAIQNKLKNGESGKLSESEENMIVKLDKEQMKSLEKNFISQNVLFDSNISLSKFDIETKLYEKLFRKIRKE